MEDLDWKKLDILKRACKYAPQIIDLEASGKLLFKLMGAVRQGGRIYWGKIDIYVKAITLDDKLADSIFRVLRLFEIVRECKDEKDRFRFSSMLRLDFQKMKSLLEKNRGAPKIRQFLELWDQSADSENEEGVDVESESEEGVDVESESEEGVDVESDGAGEEEERASKRRCLTEQ
ncbi:hypothetical protein V8C35DRAFT_288101 [Trichoderma chlorosporum]